MSNIVLIALIIGKITTTAYQSIPSQTDSSPFNTSTGERVRSGCVAVSRDLLCGACRKLHKRCKHPEYGKKLHYGDWLYARDIGFVRINDIMGAREHYRVRTKSGSRVLFKPIYNHIDVWVESYAAEKTFFKKYGVQPVEWYKVKINGD